MRSKIVILFMIICLSINSKAQYINLQKNGSLRTIRISIQKKIKVEYVTEKGKQCYKGMAYKYEYPYLYFKIKRDTILLDVRRIEKIKISSNTQYFNYILCYIPISISVALINEGFLNYGRIHIAEAAGSIIPIGITYLLIESAIKDYNTKTKWSFY